MNRFFEIMLGLRYFRAGGRMATGNRFISVISSISLAGVILGVAVLLVVLSVMNGFERELRDRILDITAHATISGMGSSTPDWQQLQQRIQSQPHVLGVAPYVEQQAMLLSSGSNESTNSGVMIHGALPDEEVRVVHIEQHMKQGRMDSLHAGEYHIVLGDELAKALHVNVGDQVIAVVAQGAVTAAGIFPRMRRFTITGIFHVGMYEYDRNFAYIHLQDAQRLFRFGDSVSGLRLKLDDVFKAQQIAVNIARELGGGYYVDDWTRKHANFFRSIAMTKSMMFLILLLVVAVAAFNVVATLVMVVKDKQSDIAILRTLGSSPRSVLAVFILQGMLIGLIGTMGGIVLGTVLSWNLESIIHGLEHLFNTHFMDAKLYFMSDLPACVEWHDVLKIGSVAFGMCCVSTLYPAWRAARTEPAKALRRD
ncbi:MAG TPA: lipoprotein-releasing ABC transporter permease subunit [Steroidobacteraceae bacterium]|nr:lipoprotein-releasing ABC transporter permease subunit [Steroidobacteraceae bacterium]